MKQGEITKAYCSVCLGERNHIVLFALEDSWDEQFADHPAAYISGKDRYELLKCAGCGRVMLRHTNWFSEETDEDGVAIPTTTYYPPSTIRREPKWISGIDLSTPTSIIFVPLPSFVSRLLHEVYIALHNNSRGLAVMGIRALLERVMIERVGDQGTFSNNLNKFEEGGYIGKRQRESLETTLEIGHAVIHRNYDPTSKELMHALDISENVIESVYINHEQGEDLKKGIPPRPPKS